MNSFANNLKFWNKEDDASSGDEIFDRDAISLSHVGTAVHNVLRKHHNRHHHKMWNVTSGSIVDSVQQTPRAVWDVKDDPPQSHSDWFPEKLGEMIGRTEAWCDVTSLGPPDGKFMECFRSGLATLAERSRGREKPVVVRMMFGNITGMPVNCSAVIKALTKDLPDDAHVHLWVGAWRKGFSWNHSKMIAVDGMYLHTGGHNLWDAHYLTNDPVHDLSIEFEGKVACDGHRFADQQWAFVESKQRTCVGSVIDSMPDYLPMATKTRVTVSEYPEGVASVFPPHFNKDIVAGSSNQSRSNEKDVPLISIGRQGTIVRKSRPSDDAILAMINSSKKIIRMTLQDLGPVCIPGSKVALPGLKWPKAYLAAIGKAIYERGVDVEIVLSNPNSIPGGLNGTEANYGNGWDCVDVAAEIVKRIQKQYTKVDDEKLRAMIAENLRICFIRHDKQAQYADGKSIGLHSKHFIVDDTCCYIGSQNLYMCDLAEWGVVIDSEEEVKKIMDDYFIPMWTSSYTGEDVDVQKVMDGLKVNRDGAGKIFGGHNDAAAQQLMPHGSFAEYYDFENKDEDTAIEVSAGEAPVVGKNESDEHATEDDSKDNDDAKDNDNAKDNSEAALATPVAQDAASSPLEKKDTEDSNEGDSNSQTDAVSEQDAGEKTDGDPNTDPSQPATESQWNQEEYNSKNDSEDQVNKVRIDCNWCGMGEALAINK